MNKKDNALNVPIISEIPIPNSSNSEARQLLWHMDNSNGDYDLSHDSKRINTQEIKEHPLLPP